MEPLRPPPHLSEILRRRGVERIAYFHADHFEPWRIVDPKQSDMFDAGNADSIIRFVEETSALWYGKRLTLFYLPGIGRVFGERDGTLRVPGDSFGLVSRNEKQDESCRRAMHAVAGSGHEIQVHFHHEFLTPNAKYCFQYPDHAAYFVNPENNRFHSSRYDLALQLTLDLIRNDSGLALEEWFFVHGMWALNASDLDVCTITDEIERLMKAGGKGDFTFPAGRPHCDPTTFHEPSLVKPVTAVKGYDSPAADPKPAWGARGDAEGRFFIWADALATTDESFDHYSSSFAARAADVAGWAERILDKAFVAGGTLYFKTHAHSMMNSYFEDPARPVHPHQHPAVRRLMDFVGEAAEAAGARMDFLTASEVYEEFLAGEARAVPAPAAKKRTRQIAGAA